jgi:hypothetical protein
MTSATTRNCVGCGHAPEEHGGAGCLHPVEWDRLGFVKRRCECIEVLVRGTSEPRTKG